MKLLVIEDDEDIVDYIINIFQMAWPKAQIITAASGKQGMELVIKEHPNAVLLDIGLPDINGFDVLKEIRSFSQIPVIIITVRGDEKDIVKGLGLGADDYILKPFKLLEMVARVKTALRRYTPQAKDISLTYGSLHFDSSLRYILCGEQKINLTKTEGSILFKLMEAKGATVSPLKLVSEIWGEEYQDIARDIKSYIYRLRKKLETDPKNPELILTAPGEGYYLAKPESPIH